MKTTWRVVDKDGNIVFTGPNGWYGEAKKYIDDNPEETKEKGLDLDPDMK